MVTLVPGVCIASFKNRATGVQSMVVLMAASATVRPNHGQSTTYVVQL
jgi:hypothetical protein